MRGFWLYVPDWAWYLHNWVTNRENARKRYPNPVAYLRYRFKLRKAMWS